MKKTLFANKPPLRPNMSEKKLANKQPIAAPAIVIEVANCILSVVKRISFNADPGGPLAGVRGRASSPSPRSNGGGSLGERDGPGAIARGPVDQGGAARSDVRGAAGRRVAECTGR